MANEWTCPHCNRQQVITDNCDIARGRFWLGNSAKTPFGFWLDVVLCANPDCKRITVDAKVGEALLDGHERFHALSPRGALFSERIVPRGQAKAQPEFIPQAIREDYEEACLIRDLSPKASATLVRRCLQGMIRDFANIKKSRLVDEINALREAVADGTADRSITPETVEAIDHVRGVGNIGAHMEKDIDHIVPVDPGEAQALIELVEMLFEEWYVARENRKARLARIEKVSVEKAAAKAMKPDEPCNTVG